MKYFRLFPSSINNVILSSNHNGVLERWKDSQNRFGHKNISGTKECSKITNETDMVKNTPTITSGRKGFIKMD
jgi:hypothetical protein